MGPHIKVVIWEKDSYVKLWLIGYVVVQFVVGNVHVTRALYAVPGTQCRYVCYFCDATIVVNKLINKYHNFAYLYYICFISNCMLYICEMFFSLPKFLNLLWLCIRTRDPDWL